METWHSVWPQVFLLTCTLPLMVNGFVLPSQQKFALQIPSTALQTQRLPKVWVEPAEEDFVDDEENLEEGEICLVSLKAFASNDVEEKYFLCAGALVQRPGSAVCDAWTADSLLGGPNLQLQGALQLLDELLLFHLKRHQAQHKNEDDLVAGLRTFVLRCGSSDSDYTCASYMAAQNRGFRPLKDLLRENSIYTPHLYDSDWNGMVIDYHIAKERYDHAEPDAFDESSSQLSSVSSNASSEILKLLPTSDLIQRYTIKRYNRGR